MHDHQHSGSRKPDKSSPGTPGPQPKRSGRNVEGSPQDAAKLGARSKLSTRRNVESAAADPLPSGHPAKEIFELVNHAEAALKGESAKGVQLSGPPLPLKDGVQLSGHHLPVRFFSVDEEAGIGIRTVGPNLVAKDVCDALQISKYRDAIADLEEYMRGPLVALKDRLGRPQQMATLTEAGFYALALGSRRTEWAKRFAKKVYTEILPQITRTGSYNVAVAQFAALAHHPAYQPPAAGPGVLAQLPRASGSPAPDLATEHIQRLLSDLIGPQAPHWQGRIADLATAAVAGKLLWWVIRDPADVLQRGHLGKILTLRAGINYLGFGSSHLQLRTIGRNRHRKYAIIRLEDLPAAAALEGGAS